MATWTRLYRIPYEDNEFLCNFYSTIFSNPQKLSSNYAFALIFLVDKIALLKLTVKCWNPAFLSFSKLQPFLQQSEIIMLSDSIFLFHPWKFLY